MGYITEEIARDLREARKRAGLTQKELEEKTGIPQSHISRIEKGDVDVQASSLVEITRALGLELMFVPRELVPAVEGLKRELQMNSSVPYTINKDLSRRMDQLAQRFQQIANRIGTNENLNKLAQTISNLGHIKMPKAQIEELSRHINQLNLQLEHLETTQKVHKSLSNVLLNEETLKSLNKLSQAGRELQQFEHVIPKFDSTSPIQHRMYLPDGDEEEDEEEY